MLNKFAKAMIAIPFVLLLLSGFAVAEVHAKSNILFILDGSNSMWGQVDGEAKITIAQDVLETLLTDLPGDTNVGLMSYGHRDQTSCTDIELLSPIGADNPDELTKKINGIQPKGKTPIAAALTASVDAFSNYEGDSNHVVLISDGLESCDGDPCAAAGMLASASIKARVHVVGFDIGAEEREKLECISKMGNGKYFSASNAEELKVAVAEVKKEAVKPPAPVAKEYFRDNFDGEDLGDHWEVLNPNPDYFIVEDSELLVISGAAGSLANETVENLFRLSKPLPEGDWTITSKFSIEFQTGAERTLIGVVENGDNYLEIAAQAFFFKHMNSSHSAAINIEFVKRSKGAVKASSRHVWTGAKLGAYADAAKEAPQPILLRLEKSGRSYIGSAKLGDGENSKWVILDKFTMLRLKGSVSLGFSQIGATGGESAARIDWIKIEVH